MNKIIAAINMTLTGIVIIQQSPLTKKYINIIPDLLQSGESILYGRVTYQLMEYWKSLVDNPSGNKSMDEFAVVMDQIPKLVFSRTLKDVDWHSAKLATRDLKVEVRELKQTSKGDILVGSPGLIVSLMNLSLVDELQLCVHPVIAGGGMPLFKDINNKLVLELVKTKTFESGAVVLYYEIAKS